MSLYTASLNSGSNGNCYYVSNGETAVLIDAGISCRETEKRMARLGLNIRSVAAVFISHEHSDHIRGIEVLSKKYRIPVYITPNTLRSGNLNLDKELVHHFSEDKPIFIAGLTIVPFSKLHDAADPFSFVVKNDEVCIGVMTDLGNICNNVITYFKQCHAVYLEANYDVAMLEKGSYPYHLKRRISGGKGHLSNIQALELFKTHRPPFMSHVFLSHLSKDNNDPQLAAGVFEKHNTGTNIIVASRYEETALYKIVARVKDKITQKVVVKGLQMALFEL